MLVFVTVFVCVLFASCHGELFVCLFALVVCAFVGFMCLCVSLLTCLFVCVRALVMRIWFDRLFD